MSKESKYKNDASPNKASYYRNVSYVYLKKLIEILELNNNNYKNFSEELHSRCELAEESGNMERS